MESDVPRQTLDPPGLVSGNASVRTKEINGSDLELVRDRIPVNDGNFKPVIADHVVLQLKDASGTANRGGSAAGKAAGSSSRDADAAQHTSQQSADQPGRVIVDTESLKIEQIKGPDHLNEHHSGRKGLKGYLQEGTIKPVTGDQVVYRLRETGGAGSSARGDSAAASAGGAQVAVLGSPSVPVGLSSALGYLHLGQVAHIKVRQHLMQHGAADDTGEITTLPEPYSTRKAAAGSSGSASSSTPTASPAAAAAHPQSSPGYAPPRTSVSSPIQQQQQQQQVLPTHAGPQQQRPPAAAAAGMAGSSSSSSSEAPPHQQQQQFSELQTMWRQRSLDEKGLPVSHTQQQQQQQGVVRHGSPSPDIRFPHSALQPPTRHPKSAPAGLATAAPVSPYTAAAVPGGSHRSRSAAAASAVPAHRLESIPSDEVLPLPENASDHSSWLPHDSGSTRSSISSSEDAAAAAGKPTGHLNGSSSSRQHQHSSRTPATAAGVAASPGTGSSSNRAVSRQAELSAGLNSKLNSNLNSSLPGQQSPSGWSSSDHSYTSEGGTLPSHTQQHISSNRTATSAGTTTAAAAASSDDGQLRERVRHQTSPTRQPAAAAAAAGGDDREGFHTPNSSSMYYSAQPTPAGSVAGPASSSSSSCGSAVRSPMRMAPTSAAAASGGVVAGSRVGLSAKQPAAAALLATSSAAAAADRPRREEEKGTGETTTAAGAGAGGGGGGVSGLLNAPEALLKAAAQKLQQQFGSTEQDKQQQQQYPEIEGLHKPVPAPAAPKAAAAAASSSKQQQQASSKQQQQQQQLRVPAVSGGVLTTTAGKPGVVPVAVPIPGAASAAAASASGSAAISHSTADVGSFRVCMDSSSGGTVGNAAPGKGAAAAAAAAGRASSSNDAAQATSSKASGRDQQQQQQQLGKGSAGPWGGSGSDAATCGSNADARGGDGQGSVGGDAVEFELEVLAIVPGRGKLSGQPMPSDAARQQQQPLDVKGLIQDAHLAQHLQPPKPLSGCSGWVRRNLSLNMRAPWKAGKRGLGWLGLRGCLKGKKGEEDKGHEQQQKPAVSW